MKNQLRDKGLFVWLCYACLVPILKWDLESAFAVLGVNVNYKIFKQENHYPAEGILWSLK